MPGRYPRDREMQGAHGERDRWNRERERREHPHDERGVRERVTDRVRAWFGDEDPARPRYRERRSDAWTKDDPPRDADLGYEYRWAGVSREAERRYSLDRPYADRTYRRREREQPSRGRGDVDYGRDRKQWNPNPEYIQDYRPSPGFETGAEDTRRYETHRAVEPHDVHGWGDWRVAGPYVGRGPRGYHRPDDRIREEINDRLTAHGLIDATDVECQVHDGEVTLTGFVSNRTEKRAAEDVADGVPGVVEVRNHLRLRTNGDDTGVGRTSVLDLTESHTQNRAAADTAASGRSGTRTS